MRNIENLGEMGPGMMSKKTWVVNFEAECMFDVWVILDATQDYVYDI